MTGKGRFYQETIDACSQAGLAGRLRAATYRQFDARQAICLELGDVDRFRQLTCDMRDHVLRNLDHYLGKLVENLERAGTQVHWADDAEHARQTICRIASDHHVRRIVKSKSMLTREIELNGALERAGMEVTDTDLGDYIVHLARRRGGHMLNPAIFLNVHQIAEIFRTRIGYDGPDDPKALTAAARTILRETFRTADMGISGVNFAVADPAGLVCVCTNEGNGRYVTGRTRIYVAVMGIERVVGDLDGAALVLKMLARFSTGQRITQYTNFIAGPRPDGPEHVHVVLVDNGRSRILGSKYWQILRCLRCGACLNACPVFKQIGGHPFPGPYSGPLGSVLAPLLGWDDGSSIPKASSLCGLCTEVCPVKIPLPELLLELRQDSAATGGGFVEKVMMRLGAFWLSHPRLYRTGQRMMRWALVPISKGGWISWLPGPTGRWTGAKDFPLPEKRSFLQRVRSGEINVNRGRDE